MDVVIVGGGICGLATAHFLSRSLSVQDSRLPSVCLVEGSPRFGGKVLSERFDGFLVEGGPDSFLRQKSDALELVDELGLADQLVPSNDHKRRVFLVRQGRLVPLPEGLQMMVPTRWKPFFQSPLLSVAGRLRVALEPWIPARRATTDESLASFVRRRFGREALATLAEPQLAAIYLGDSERLSLEATFPSFAQLERSHGSLVRGLRRRPGAPPRLAGIHLSTPGSPPPEPMFWSLREGVGSLTEALERRLQQAGVTLSTGQPVTAIERLRAGWRVHRDGAPSLDADAVVLAVPAAVAARLAASGNPALAEGLGELRAVSAAVVSLGYRELDLPRPLDGFGFFVPAQEGRRIVASTWTSTKFDHRAPAGHVLLRMFVGGLRGEQWAELPEGDLLALARAELGDLLGLTAEPVMARIHRWPQGYPQYEVGHRQRVTELTRRAEPGLYLAGSAFHGVGLSDCVASAAATAKAIRHSPR
ncbi:MAG: protoporphyrinogen oxidase [Acidobacteriota bacterium]